MKKRYLRISKRATLLLCLLVTYIITVSAQFTQKRILERTEPVRQGNALEINNKYGKIEITLWNRDSVYIRTEIQANASTQSRTDKMLSGIRVDFETTQYLIRAKTVFDPSPGMLIESFKGMTSKVLNFDSGIEISYYVKIPRYMSLRLDNRYGDVFMEDIKGDLRLNLSNGSFKAGSVEGSCELNLDLANAVIYKTTLCRIDGSFSEILMNEADAMTINSISSRFETGNITDLTIESRRDKIFIRSLGTLRGNSYFSHVRIDRLISEADIDARYGNLTISEIDKTFKKINIRSGYSDIYLTFGKSASYNLYLRHTNTFVSLPQEGADFEKKAVNEERKEYITTGTIGRPAGKQQVDIEANRGTVSLK